MDMLPLISNMVLESHKWYNAQLATEQKLPAAAFEVGNQTATGFKR